MPKAISCQAISSDGHECPRRGRNAVRITNSVSFDGNPAWSPDGKKIAFQSNRDGNNEIYVVTLR